jgi:hypothetical protein
MSDNAQKLIQDLIFFYVKENYKKYIEKNNIKIINDKKLPSVIDELYIEKKNHLKTFLKDSLKEIMKDEYIGDLVVDNICYDIFNDDKLCKNRLILEIQLYQQKLNNQSINYDKLLN